MCVHRAIEQYYSFDSCCIGEMYKAMHRIGTKPGMLYAKMLTVFLSD